MIDTSNFIQGKAGTRIQGWNDMSKPDDLQYQFAEVPDDYNAGDAGKDILTSAISGAGAGAALGLWGVVGGGVAGLGLGVWNAFGNNKSNEKERQAAEEYNAKMEAQRAYDRNLKKEQNQFLTEAFQADAARTNLENYKSSVNQQQQYQF